MTYQRKNRGVCSLSTTVTLSEDGTIENVEVLGGCNGNLKGICSLLKGMKAQDAIGRMRGTTCGSRPTSCPDQIAQALEEALAQYGKCGAFLMRAAGRKRLCACPLAAAAILAQGKGRRRCYTDSKGLIRPRAGC